MRHRRITVLTVCLAALATSTAAVASASASEFVFSKTGTLKGKALASQEFTTSAGSFECTGATTSGSVTTLKTATQKTTAQYEGCSFFGVPMTVSPAEYELSASGTFKLLKALTMKATSICTMTFPAQSLSGIAYKNEAGGKLALESTVTGLESSGSGALCTYSKSKGTFTGKSLVELEGGTVEVK